MSWCFFPALARYACNLTAKVTENFSKRPRMAPFKSNDSEADLSVINSMVFVQLCCWSNCFALPHCSTKFECLLLFVEMSYNCTPPVPELVFGLKSLSRPLISTDVVHGAPAATTVRETAPKEL